MQPSDEQARGFAFGIGLRLTRGVTLPAVTQTSQ